MEYALTSTFSIHSFQGSASNTVKGLVSCVETEGALSNWPHHADSSLEQPILAGAGYPMPPFARLPHVGLNVYRCSECLVPAHGDAARLPSTQVCQ